MSNFLQTCENSYKKPSFLENAARKRGFSQIISIQVFPKMGIWFSSISSWLSGFRRRKSTDFTTNWMKVNFRKPYKNFTTWKIDEFEGFSTNYLRKLASDNYSKNRCVAIAYFDQYWGDFSMKWASRKSCKVFETAAPKNWHFHSFFKAGYSKNGYLIFINFGLTWQVERAQDRWFCFKMSRKKVKKTLQHFKTWKSRFFQQIY